MILVSGVLIQIAWAFVAAKDVNVMVASGLTVIFTVIGVPIHPLAEGVIV